METTNQAQKTFQKEIKKSGFRPEPEYVVTGTETVDGKLLENGNYARVATDNEGEEKGFQTTVFVFNKKGGYSLYEVKFTFGTPISVITNFLHNL